MQKKWESITNSTTTHIANILLRKSGDVGGGGADAHWKTVTIMHTERADNC